MTSRSTIMHKLLAAAVVVVGLAGATAAPALADDWRGRGHEWGEHGWRGHEWREHEWREHHAWRPYGYSGYAPGYSYYSGYYYVPPPPPAVYVPPPAPSLTFVVPIH